MTRITAAVLAILLLPACRHVRRQETAATSVPDLARAEHERLRREFEDRQVGLSVRTRGLAVTPAAVWYSADVRSRLETPAPLRP